MPRDAPMKAHAATFALLMIASSLAGCTTAGTDGVPEVTLDDEDIETFLDDYFQDFVNNSSVVINQEIHYHNETTVNEGDDSSVRHYNGSSPQSYILIEHSYVASDFELENREDRATNTFNKSGYFYDPAMGEYREQTLVVSCEGYHLDGPYGSYWNFSNYESREWYENAWNYLYNDDLRHIYSQEAYTTEIRLICDPTYYESVFDGEHIHLGDISIPAGYGMTCPAGPQLYRHSTTDYNLPGNFGPYNAVSVYMYDEGKYVSCTVPSGDGDSDTAISLFVRYGDLALSSTDEYHFYFMYQLVEVTNGELA